MNIIQNNKKLKINDIYDALSAEAQKSLMDYAEFLYSRDVTPETPAQHKLDIPRPDHESVVAAIKRLNQTYPMIERKLVFHDASSLMTSHVLQGRSAVEVIDELEALFDRHYQEYLEASVDKLS